MSKRAAIIVTAIFFLLGFSTVVYAEDMEVLGVKFPGETTIEGKTLKLNGVAYRKALGFVKVYAVGLYLEHPSQDPREVIESEQVKYLLTHYLTKKATAKKIQKGFLEVIEECNPPELVQANQADIDTYASWLNKDMAPGLTSYSIYIPGKGLTMTYQGEVRGTIPGSTFMQMYYRYNVGEKAPKKIRKGLLGL